MNDRRRSLVAVGDSDTRGVWGKPSPPAFASVATLLALSPGASASPTRCFSKLSSPSTCYPCPRTTVTHVPSPKTQKLGSEGTRNLRLRFELETTRLFNSTSILGFLCYAPSLKQAGPPVASRVWAVHAKRSGRSPNLRYGFHSRANCNARCRTASLIVWSEEMALSHSDCGLSWSRRK